VLPFEQAGLDTPADLTLLVIESGSERVAHREELARPWVQAGRRALVLIHKPYRQDDSGRPYVPEKAPPTAAMLVGPLDQPAFLSAALVPVALNQLPKRHLSLARHFPVFRMAVAHELINDACLSNAAYALSTGLAEIVPALSLPLTVTDMIILTKAQAFLVYRMGLALGLSTEWRAYVAEFGGVLGGGFLWRQLARSLVGLIPAWGILPKVAVAYAGTYAVGQVVLQWYLTGRHLPANRLADVYRQALQQGKVVARGLVEKMPRPRLPGRKKKALPAPAQACPDCGKANNPDALFCQYCGRSFGILLEGQAGDIQEPPAEGSPA
jgi:uncharacterized protein (DUF697 family)